MNRMPQMTLISLQTFFCCSKSCLQKKYVKNFAEKKKSSIFATECQRAFQRRAALILLLHESKYTTHLIHQQKILVKNGFTVNAVA
jgi:hypothetical protein